jgi:hypothetical protein
MSSFGVFNVDHDFEYYNGNITINTTDGSYSSSSLGNTDSITVASPLLPTEFNASPALTNINQNPKLICTQTVELTQSNWNWETPRIFGINGNLSMIVSGGSSNPYPGLIWSATIESITAGIPETAISGYLYYSNTNNITIPVNFISVTDLSPPYNFKSFEIGDIIKIRIYAAAVSTTVGNITIVTPPQLLQAIFSGLSL